MSMRERRNQAVKDRADWHYRKEPPTSETYLDLGVYLNSIGITNSDGNPYGTTTPGDARGLAGVARNVWANCKARDEDDLAERVANAFTGQDGIPAWKK